VETDIAAGYPSVWFDLSRKQGDSPLSAALMGFDWANRHAPTTWFVGDETKQAPEVRHAGESINLPILVGARVLYAAYADDAGITGCLRFAPAPSSLRVDDSGIYWDYPSAVAEARVEYLPIASKMAPSTIIALAARLANRPTDLKQEFGCDGQGHPWVELSASNSGVMLPPALAGSQDAKVPTVEGQLGATSTSKVTVAMSSPPHIDSLSLSVTPLGPADRKQVNAWVSSAISHQLPTGSFDFSQSRGFYDGMTCCTLAEVYPYLTADLRPRVKAALLKGLGHLWDDQQTCTAWPAFKVAPEQSFFIQTGVDYPEIMGFILQATALYTANVDPAYVSTRWPQIERQFSQLRVDTDWTGLAFANPGPEFYQIIPEGSIGGYLGWHALYHLAKMNHAHALAGEARARAAYAWASFLSLYRWRPEFGEAVVNGINQGQLEVKGASPWTYFQYTWFTFLPAFSLPHDDTMHIWHMLDRMPWWEWTGTLKSRQRANDAANVTALFRAGYASDALAHRDIISGRPVWWDAFDFTPVLLIPAEFWAHDYTIRARR
jgi:hypothetical protein